MGPKYVLQIFLSKKSQNCKAREKIRTELTKNNQILLYKISQQISCEMQIASLAPILYPIVALFLSNKIIFVG
jgi:hypothetical protein